MVSQSELANAKYYMCVGELAKLLLCTSIALLFVLSCSAQINSSEVTGIVTDATDAVINFASV